MSTLPDFEAGDFMENFDLLYSATSQKGYSRIKENGKFIYLDTRGKPIDSEKILERIAKLVLPPAWESVWICTKANGHLQATGIDAKGRKQYRYHPNWEKIRNETKFNQLYYFGKNLGKLRKQLKKDLRRKSLDKEKVIALALSIMEITFLRVGNTAYEKEYGSHGLTTLKNKHVRFLQGHAFFKFKGKKGVQQLVEMKSVALANLLKKVKELPGQEVFQYYGEDKSLQALDSSDVNNYLKKYMEGNFTCKDFRTWAGCIAAIECMLQNRVEEEITKTGLQKNLVAIIDQVAGRLGNTRAVCRKYYIHPQLLKKFEEGKLEEVLAISKTKSVNPEVIEKALLYFLKKELGEQALT